MKKRILWRSDLWPFTLTFAVFTGLFLLITLAHAVDGGSSGEILALACVSAITATFMCGMAFTDRTETMWPGTRELSLDELVKAPRLAHLRKGTMLDPEHPVIAEHIRNPPTLG